MQLQGYNLTGITETCWDGLCIRCAVIDAYRLFRKDRPTWQGQCVVLYVRAVGMHRALPGDE